MPVQPVRFLPVSVLLQQRKEEAQKAAEESEALATLEQETDAATNPTVATDVAEETEAKQDTSMGDAQSEETASAKVTESAYQGVGGDAEANRTEPVTSSQNESTAAPKEEKAASMDVDQSNDGPLNRLHHKLLDPTHCCNDTLCSLLPGSTGDTSSCFLVSGQRGHRYFADNLFSAESLENSVRHHGQKLK